MARGKTMLRNCTWGYSAVAAHHDTTGHPSFSSRWIGCNVTRFRFRNVDKAGCVVYAHARNGIKLKRKKLYACYAAQKEMWKCRWCSLIRSGGPFSSPPISSFFLPCCFKRSEWMPAGCWGLWERRVGFGGAVRRGGAEVGSGRARAGRGTKKGTCMPARGRWPPEPGRSPA